MNWSEIILILLLGLSVPLGLFIYEKGEERGWKDYKREQNYILSSSHTWLWVNGHFYSIDATEDQMEQVKASERAREFLNYADANVKED